MLTQDAARYFSVLGLSTPTAPRPGSAAGRCSAATTRARRTPSPAASPRRCSTACSPRPEDWRGEYPNPTMPGKDLDGIGSWRGPGSDAGSIGSLRELDERLGAADSLTEVLDSLAEAITIRDPNNRLVYANRAAA